MSPPIRFFRCRFLPGAALMTGMLCAAAASSAPTAEPDMMQLAQERGCTLCHSLDMPKAVGSQVPPIGPTWRDIARKYHGTAGATETLAGTILMGSGANGGATHWAGRASGVEMPANRVEVSEADARRLAGWILSLPR